MTILLIIMIAVWGILEALVDPRNRLERLELKRSRMTLAEKASSDKKYHDLVNLVSKCK